MLCSKVDKISKILIKILNATEHIESDVQNLDAPRINVTII